MNGILQVDNDVKMSKFYSNTDIPKITLIYVTVSYFGLGGIIFHGHLIPISTFMSLAFFRPPLLALLQHVPPEIPMSSIA